MSSNGLQSPEWAGLCPLNLLSWHSPPHATFQPLSPLFHSSNAGRLFLPQGLCTSCFPVGNTLPLCSSSHDFLFLSLQILTRMSNPESLYYVVTRALLILSQNSRPSAIIFSGCFSVPVCLFHGTGSFTRTDTMLGCSLLCPRLLTQCKASVIISRKTKTKTKVSADNIIGHWSKAADAVKGLLSIFFPMVP